MGNIVFVAVFLEKGISDFYRMLFVLALILSFQTTFL